ncbi:hypothetical protein LENED_010288 [Lentinula edodes]|uniref:Uncharacterized protein n=1 Tax=Lentinula edodes TaxID=5353 RepID=A0A1Q3EM23_LENED|nr:hypothetical protein LENED_010288 [Lentinula edodes]
MYTTNTTVYHCVLMTRARSQNSLSEIVHKKQDPDVQESNHVDVMCKVAALEHEKIKLTFYFIAATTQSSWCHESIK